MDLQETLNKLLEQDGEVIQVLVNEIRVKTVPHDRNSSKLDITDVFNGQIPYSYVYFATRQDYFNGDPFVPPTRCSWEGLTNFHLTVHGQQRGPAITNSQQAYFHLRRVLHLNNDQLRLRRLRRRIRIHSIRNSPDGRQQFKSIAVKHQSILGSHCAI